MLNFLKFQWIHFSACQQHVQNTLSQMLQMYIIYICAIHMYMYGLNTVVNMYM